MRPELRSMALADPPAAWEALGFTVTGGVVAFDGVCLRLLPAGVQSPSTSQGARQGARSTSASPGTSPSGNFTSVDPSEELGEKPFVARGKSSGSGIPATRVDFPLSAESGAAEEPPALDSSNVAPVPSLVISNVTVADLDGVPVVAADAPPPPAVDAALPPASGHTNGVIGVDHFVIVTPDFDRTAAACAAAGMPFRRVRDAGGFRQGFRRLGPAILEVVEAVNMPPGPARFWGLTLIASDLDALALRLGDRLHAPKDAVQPGRRIATLDRSAGLSVPVAFMTPE